MVNDLDTNFIVLKEKGKIICIIKKSYRGNTKAFKGVAKCYYTDTFDEEYGKHIAELKAMAKKYSYDVKLSKAVAKEAQEVIGHLKKEQALYEGYLDKALEGYKSSGTRLQSILYSLCTKYHVNIKEYRP